MELPLVKILNECVWHLLPWLSVIDENNLRKTSQEIHQLIYTWRHWIVCGLPCLTRRQVEAPAAATGHLFHPSNRFIIPNHSDQSLMIQKLSSSLCRERHFDNYYLRDSSSDCDCGWGVYARRVIPSHHIVDYYSGEFLSTRECHRRYERYYDRQVGSGQPSLFSFSEDESLIDCLVETQLCADHS
jgi:hypothetical protein